MQGRRSTKSSVNAQSAALASDFIDKWQQIGPATSRRVSSNSPTPKCLSPEPSSKNNRAGRKGWRRLAEVVRLCDAIQLFLRVDDAYIRQYNNSSSLRPICTCTHHVLSYRHECCPRLATTLYLPLPSLSLFLSSKALAFLTYSFGRPFKPPNSFSCLCAKVSFPF